MLKRQNAGAFRGSKTNCPRCAPVRAPASKKIKSLKSHMFIKVEGTPAWGYWLPTSILPQKVWLGSLSVGHCFLEPVIISGEACCYVRFKQRFLGATRILGVCKPQAGTLSSQSRCLGSLLVELSFGWSVIVSGRNLRPGQIRTAIF